jgi:hypothetical protein
MQDKEMTSTKCWVCESTTKSAVYNLFGDKTVCYDCYYDYMNERESLQRLIHDARKKSQFLGAVVDAAIIQSYINPKK